MIMIMYALFSQTAVKDMQRWSTPGSQVSKDPTQPVVLRKNKEGTQHLLSQDWSLVAIDEIHEARNVNNVFRACLYLARKSGVCLGLTATPLYTQPSVSPSDVAAWVHALFDSNLILSLLRISSIWAESCE